MMTSRMINCGSPRGRVLGELATLDLNYNGYSNADTYAGVNLRTVFLKKKNTCKHMHVCSYALFLFVNV